LVIRIKTAAVAVVATTLVGFVVAFVAAGSSGGARAAAAHQSVPEPLHGVCPKQRPQRLPGDALAGATLAALDEAHVIYRGLDLKGIRATEAILAVNDPARGGYARSKCGRLVQSRTVVVYLQFPALLPSASLSQGVVLVARFSGQYRVWAQLH
jgi:hypothetical protein